MATRSAVMNIMTKAAIKAGRALTRDFNEVEHLQVSKKGPADFVSAADIKAEKILYHELMGGRPDFGILMEERGEENPKSHSRWIVDPLDGTTNYLHGLPHWAISIAFEASGKIHAGVVYDPAKDELFWAESGRGAYLNDRRLRVSGRKKLDTALIATGIPFAGKEGHDQFRKELEEIAPRVAGIRRFGSASLDLAYVAAGRYDGFWESNLSAWDIAAGIILVREAGGYVSELDGGSNMLQSGSILAANDALHGPLERRIRAAHRQLKNKE